MELRHLRYFLALAETLHFGQAAERLGIVQPALSMQIKALEEEVGVALFRRSRREVALTQAGRLFLGEARRSLAHAEQAGHLAREAAQGAIGQLRLGFSAGAVHSGILRRVVLALRNTSPGLRLDLVESHPAEAPEAIRKGDLDASLGTTVSVDLGEGLQARRMASHPLVLVLPDDHPLQHLAEIEPEALRRETFIGYAAHEDMDGMALTTHALGYMPERHRQVGSPAMTIGLVAAGLGVAVVPESLKRDEEGAIFRHLKGRESRIDVTLLWHDAGEPGTSAAIARALQVMPLPEGL
ncbi:MAG: LysR family transcriptional regulator [Alphaproteobacteria bacterium]|nr:LysR family transcriptional regulator [Alphaproteobacteria bacterium]